MPLVALGVLGAVGSIGGGAIAAHGASNAADTQSAAAVQAAQINAQAERESLGFQREQLGFQKDQYNTEQQKLAPYVTAGQGAVTSLSDLLEQGKNGQGPLAPWTGTFQAPTGATEQNDPGYQFRLQQGEQALQNSAAARGNLFTGDTGKALEGYAQDYASNEYGNVYNRSFQQYLQGYNQFQQNSSNTYNRYANLAGLGQTAEGQSVSSTGQIMGAESAAGAQNANITMSGAQSQGQAAEAAAAARGSGYAAGGNIWGNAFSGATNSLSLATLLGHMNGSAPVAPATNSYLQLYQAQNPEWQPGMGG